MNWLTHISSHMPLDASIKSLLYHACMRVCPHVVQDVHTRHKRHSQDWTNFFELTGYGCLYSLNTHGYIAPQSCMHAFHSTHAGLYVCKQQTLSVQASIRRSPTQTGTLIHTEVWCSRAEVANSHRQVLRLMQQSKVSLTAVVKSCRQVLKSRSRKFTQAGAPNDAAVPILASSTCKLTQDRRSDSCCHLMRTVRRCLLTQKCTLTQAAV